VKMVLVVMAMVVVVAMVVVDAVVKFPNLFTRLSKCPHSIPYFRE